MVSALWLQGLADSGKLAQARQVAERGLSDLRGYMPVNSSHNDNIDIHLKVGLKRIGAFGRRKYGCRRLRTPPPDPSGPSGSSPAAAPSDSNSSNKRPPTDIGSGLADKRAFQSDPSTQMGMGLDPGAIQAVSATLGVWDEDGCLESFHSSKLTRRQVQHDSGLIQARRSSQQWHDNVKLKLQHLAAATPAVTSLVAIQQHVDVTQAAWDAVWGEYLHPKWAVQRMRLYGAQEKVLERYLKKACRKVVERPNSGRPTDRVKGYVVTVDEFRTSRVSSAMNSPQPREEELDRSKPTRPEDWKP
ncbi:hypothetical protein QJQ45_006231 [Haematococcus lacustris]|nr:hypothetical protein QJQ45_006231 [Haematococcus lacustris]